MAASKDYAAIAAKAIMRPAEVTRPPRFLIYSRNKKGKTTFSISGGPDRTLVLDPEHGSSEMKTKNPHVWPIEKWEDMDDAFWFLRTINECKSCKVPHSFDWVSVDGLTKMANLSLKYVMRLAEERSLSRIPGMVQKQDYGKSGELMKDMLGMYHNLPMGIIFTAQERQVEATESDEDDEVEGAVSSFVPDLPKGARGSANAIVDVIGRLYVVRTEVDGKSKSERRLWIGDSPRYDTGYRSDFVLPDYVRNPTVPKMVRLIRTGSVAAPAKAAATAAPRKKTA